MELSNLKGIGPVRLKALKDAGIFTIRDLIYFLPIRYEDHTCVTPCSCRTVGSFMFQGIIKTDPRTVYFGKRTKTTMKLSDQTGSINLCWFNQPWISKSIRKNDNIYVYGKLHEFNNVWYLVNPSIVYDREIMPIYKHIKGIPGKCIRNLIKSSANYVKDECPEILNDTLLEKYRLISRYSALMQAHFPISNEQIFSSIRRITFERMLIYLSVVACNIERNKASFLFEYSHRALDDYWNSLPFDPTISQRRVLEEISYDLRRSTAMHRLVQGDVGCGKTAVAFGAVYLAKIAGFQSAMMAPTEILARQHYTTANEFLSPLGIKCRLLIASLSAKDRRNVLEDLKTGCCDVVFGTHALISNDVKYFKLGLTITDEQHRFGVKQRSSLQKKGNNGDNLFPHVLVMSATPIPRTLALILYGDLDYSVINDMPPGRQAVKTRIVPASKRTGMYDFLKEQVKAGRQAYVVCPLVEANDDNEITSVLEMFELLRNGPLAGLNIGLTWGSQKSEDKVNTLQKFTEGNLDVLVTTTVIEVGVNVPNASIMIIEDAGRFGLSQLHQLRGRVGRGCAQSWCFLVSEPNERLKVLTETSDGFEIAKKDLEFRGPGDIIGTRQSGEEMNMIMPHDGTGYKLLEDAVNCIRELRSDTNNQSIIEGLCNNASEIRYTDNELDVLS